MAAGPGGGAGRADGSAFPADDKSVAGARRYRVLHAVGKGGFGTVYRAELLGAGGFRKDVALKVLNPDALALDPHGAIGVAERLRDEARLLGMLGHRAVVHVDGLYQLDGRWTVVMEYVPGADLKQLVAHHGRLPVGVALELCEEVARALDHAWRRTVDGPDGEVPLRLLHRDIKPANIRLTPDGQVKVLDFGVARAEFADREADTRDIHFGSLDYMAPERLDGIDRHQGDVYGLGTVLYELLVGTRVGRTSGNRERHDEHIRAALHTLWDLHPHEPLYQLVGTCLLYDPDARPDARELARQCRQLRRDLGELELAEWAERAVPGVVATSPALDDDLSGATLVEQGLISGGVTEDSRPLPARSGPRLAVVAGLTAAVVVAIGLIAGALVMPGLLAEPPAPVAADPLDALGDSLGGVSGEEEVEPAVEEEAVEEEAVEEVAAEEPAADEAPAAAAESAAAAQPAAAEPPAPSPAASAKPSTSSTRTASRPKPAAAQEPLAQALGTARLQADGGVDVVLQGAAGTFSPGRMPAGSYTVRARFPDGRTDTATVTVPADGTVTISCVAAMGKCLPL
ncbi:MAG: protein kinase [Alphaproteobacteria bacterium]|nr:protein kinase [Alphaproteobacteria bacterium]